ncbi:complement component 1 Q subcomponent-binding protein, mitochondrial-like [Pollicipes pollicipes]|uniref:complement component 1 Q subcomponent-binding protein, mitochondrial-like n=1 Tax=Pollicipes pollicipes TaxID=41117 RepID=UPI0018849366|nr:complement component 1 Q subcomponent-binding protein, mitochondrial-like [Pollicipes pollicipes]
MCDFCGPNPLSVCTKQKNSDVFNVQKQYVRCLQSSGDKELLDFLGEEIVAETKQGKSDKLPSRIGEFDVKLDQAEVTLTRQHNNETVTVTLNVNHSVDSDPESEDLTESQGSEQLKARPTFNVDLQKKGRTVSFTCSYTDGGVVEQQGEQYNDSFSIDEVVMFEGEHHEKNFSVSGEILDGVLYDLLMNMLEERGVSNEFAQKLSDFCTEYEHKCYIALLEGMRGFVRD